MLKTSFINVFIKFAALATIFFFQSFLSKIISIQDYAEFSKFITYGNYTALILSFGFSSSILFFSKNQDVFTDNYRVISLFYLCIFSVLAPILLIFNTTFFYIIIFAISFNLFNVSLALFQHQLRMVFFAVVGAGNALYLISLLLLSQRYEAVIDYLLFLYSLYFIFVVFIFQIKFRPRTFNNIKFISLIERLKMNLQYGYKFVPVLILGQLIYVSDFIFVDNLLGDEQVAFYFVAMMLSKLIFSAADTVGNIIYPYLIKFENGADRDNILNNISTLNVLFIFVNIFIVISFMLLGEKVILFFFGDNYMPAFLPALILLSGTHGMVIYKFLSRKLASENRWKGIYFSLITAVIVNIILNSYLITPYGIIGASVASFISYWVCGFMIYYHNRTSGLLNEN